MIPHEHISEKSLVAGLIVVAIAGLALASTGTSQLWNTSERAQAQEQEQPTPATIKVAAGGGNATAPWTIFVPQRVEVKEGQSVTWHNPTKDVGEPHTVTFVLDNSTMAGVVSPLGVPSTTKFDALPPGSNNEAVLLPDTNGSATNTILAVNARTYQPTLIDAQGNVTFMKPNANYSMTGSEIYQFRLVSSKWSRKRIPWFW